MVNSDWVSNQLLTEKRVYGILWHFFFAIIAEIYIIFFTLQRTENGSASCWNILKQMCKLSLYSRKATVFDLSQPAKLKEIHVNPLKFRPIVFKDFPVFSAPTSRKPMTLSGEKNKNAIFTKEKFHFHRHRTLAKHLRDSGAK